MLLLIQFTAASFSEGVISEGETGTPSKCNYARQARKRVFEGGREGAAGLERRMRRVGYLKSKNRKCRKRFDRVLMIKCISERSKIVHPKIGYDL